MEESDPMPAVARPLAPEEKLLACVHCGLCLEACPTYVETGAEADSPRGRIYLMKALAEGRIEPTADVVGHLDLCLGCRACETACPSGVEYGALIEGGRRFVEESFERPRAERRLRRRLQRWLPEPSRLALAAPWLRLANRIGVPRLARSARVPRALRRLAALLPEMAPGRTPPLLEPEGEPLGTVALLTGCVSSVFFARVNELTARLLALAGWRVVVPARQVCCGALLAHLGEEDEAVRLARRNASTFLLAEADYVVTNAAGCGAMLRDYGRLLGGDPGFRDGAARLAARVRDVSELLAAGRLPVPPARERLRLAYHDACHLAHGQGVREAPREILRSIPGIELVEIPGAELCCGSAGTYNLTEPDMAWRLGERRAAAIRETGAAMVAAGNPGCILQLRAVFRLAGEDLPVRHPVEILADAHGLA